MRTKLTILLSLLLLSCGAEAERKVKPISTSLYKQLVEAQMMIDPTSLPREAGKPPPIRQGTPQEGIALLYDLLKRKRLNANEKSQIWNLLAFGFYTLNDMPNAEIAYQELIRVSKEGAILESLEINATRALFQLYYQREDYEAALLGIADWERLTGSLDPGVTYLKATALYQLEKFYEALQVASTLKELSKQSGTEYKENWAYLLVVLYVQLNQTTELVESLRFMTSNWPKEEYFRQLYGIYTERAELFSQKLDLIRQFRELYGDRATEMFLSSVAGLDQKSKVAYTPEESPTPNKDSSSIAQETGCVTGNCINGKGTYYYKNGNRYDGNFFKGNRHGKGALIQADGSIDKLGIWERDEFRTSQTHFLGCLVGDCVNGKGTYYYKSGNRYEGDWVDGKRSGKGTVYYKNGNRYVGDYVNGKANGEGTFYLADEQINKQDIWKDDVLGQAMILNETPKSVQQQAAQMGVDTQPPEITMQRGIKVVAKARHTVRGKAIDPSGVAIVEVNGKEAALDADGNFSVTILLVPGANEVTITATDTLENTGYKTFSITRESSAPMLAPQMSSIETGEYHALLIGVDEYESSEINPLSEPVKDATALRNILVTNYSFDSSNVKQLTNPTRGEILDELDRLSERLTKSDNLLIFYAGHGYWDESRQEGYWLPSDADQNRRRDWVSNATVVSAINGIKTQHTLLISDACFSGGIFETRSAFNNIPPATESLYDLPSRKAMTSGTLNEVPDRSVFIEYLIQRLEDNEDKYATSQDLFTRLRTAVINNSPTRQVPQFGEIRETGDEGGDFIFVRR